LTTLAPPFSERDHETILAAYAARPLSPHEIFRVYRVYVEAGLKDLERWLRRADTRA
jgi:hypothetical protein